MTHKKQCICYCLDYLNQLSLGDIFSQSLFMDYYRKHNGALGNAYWVGINAADLMIREHQNTKEAKL